MALVGTGINHYNVYNEPVLRQSDRPYDILKNEDVFEVVSVSSLPIYSSKNNPENIRYDAIERDVNNDIVNGEYEIKEGKYIVWKPLTDLPVQPTLVNVDTDPYANAGCRAFHNPLESGGSGNIAFEVSADSYKIIDGNWRIEVTYAAEQDGCYRIINNDTNESLGEFVVSDEINTAIPGINLVVKSTYKATAGSEENLIQAGDYIIYHTTANKTEQEAKVTLTSNNTKLKYSIASVNIINASLIEDASYRIVITDASKKSFIVTKINTANATEERFYPENLDEELIWTEDDELYDIIPGVEIIFAGLKYEPAVNDSIDITTTARVLNNTVPGEGDTYYVTYKYRKAEANYEAQYFTEYKNIVAEYGNYSVTQSGIVINSLSLGAEIAFANGISQIICVQAKGNTDAEFCQAIDRLRKSLPGVDNVNTIVPLSTSPAVGNYCATHVTTMSSYDYAKERMCYLGAYMDQPISKAPSGNDRSLGIVETCVGYANERVVYVVPGKVIKSIYDYDTGKSYDRPLDASYMAVAVAALGLTSDPAAPMTNQTIAGFSYIPNAYNNIEMNLMASKGACVIFMRGNSFVVRHAVTTDPSNVNTTEITCVQIKDYVIEAARSSCQQFIGQKNTESAISNVEYVINSILSQFVNRSIIESFDGPSVERSSEDPRAINVSFSILPIYSITYIDSLFFFIKIY